MSLESNWFYSCARTYMDAYRGHLDELTRFGMEMYWREGRHPYLVDAVHNQKRAASRWRAEHDEDLWVVTRGPR